MQTYDLSDNQRIKMLEKNSCCTPKSSDKSECPICHAQSKSVLSKTLEHLLTDKAKATLLSLDGFYYCKSHSCEVVYFKDDTILSQKDVRVVVGHKKEASPETVCYCFKWTKQMIKIQLQEEEKSTVTEDIKYKMNTIGCSCETLNPSGRCCLSDVGKALKEIKKDLGL